MNVVVERLRPVESDIIQAAEWYDDQQPGLGSAFARQVEGVIASLSTDAFLHRIRFSDVRRAPVQRFANYGVFYIVRQDKVVVFSVFHGARDPRWLRERRRQVG